MDRLKRRHLNHAATYCDTKTASDYLCRLAKESGLCLMRRKQCSGGWLVMRYKGRRKPVTAMPAVSFHLEATKAFSSRTGGALPLSETRGRVALRAAPHEDPHTERSLLARRWPFPLGAERTGNPRVADESEGRAKGVMSSLSWTHWRRVLSPHVVVRPPGGAGYDPRISGALPHHCSGA